MQGSDQQLGINTLVAPTIPVLANPTINADATIETIWPSCKKSRSAQKKYPIHLSLVWGQCTNTTQSKVEAAPSYEQIANENNDIKTLKLIKDIVLIFSSQKYLPHAIHKAKIRLFLEFQGWQLNVKEYLEQFTNHANVLNHIGANNVDDSGILQQSVQGPCIADAHKSEAQEQYYTAAFIMGVDRDWFGKLIEDLENSHLLGDDVYFKTINEAYN